ncbi:MAG: ferrous iron transporter B, partial [Chloroflexi bacterium]|nr:ferrous iron transporter B [Chloroflexota bacterium]
MSPETLTTCPRCAPTASPAATVTVATLALVGNPNAGKTSVFNALTGQHQHVGNWPGKTVAYQEGLWPGPQGPVRIVDLPGTYSLAALSPEERLARDALLQMPFDAVLNVVDASHLGRHLYLTAEVLELGLPTLVVLNMWDVARREGIRVDVARLEELLGVPVVPAVARDAHGTALLQQRLAQWLAAGPRPGRAPRYPARLEQAAAEIQELLAAALPDLPEARLRGLALKMLEDQTDLLAALLPPEQAQALAAQVQARVAAYRRAWGEDPALLVADARYGWV